MEFTSTEADISRLSSFIVKDADNLQPGFKELLLDVLGSVANGKIAAADLVTGIKTIEQWRAHESIQTEFCDAVWLLGTQLTPKSAEWTNLCAVLKELISAQLVDLVKLKVAVDVGLLADIGGVVPEEAQVKKMLVKQNTSMLYQQQKYNLLREESEGFSKLAVALAHLPSNPRAAEPHIRHIFAIVGQFDLDPNRLLDVVLDAAEQSAWNPSFVALLRHFKLSHIASIVGLKFVNYQNKSKSAEPPSTIAVSGSASDSKEPKKVQESSSSAAGDNNASAASSSPASLYSMAATLLSHDLLTLEQLLPYLAPAIEDVCVEMRKQEQALRREAQSFGVVSLNAIRPDSEATAKPAAADPAVPVLSDGPGNKPPPPKSAAPSKEAKVELKAVEDELEDEWSPENPPSAALPAALFSDGNQITGLISALLGLRCWDLARALIRLFESRGVDVMRVTSVRAATIALLRWRLDSLYESVSMRRNKFARAIGYCPSSDPQRSVAVWDAAATAAELGPSDALSSVETGRLAVQFGPHQCLPFPSLETLPADAEDSLRLLGSHISQSPELFTCLCRLLRAHRDRLLLPGSELNPPPTFDATRKQQIAELPLSALEPLHPMLSLVSAYLLPALSGEGGAFLSGLVWSLLGPLPFAVRFAVYGSWQAAGSGKESVGAAGKATEVAYQEVRALHACKGYMKRLSKENTRAVGRQLARLSHGSPVPVFSHILNQIEAFDNLIPVVVEALRYSTDLSRDVLANLFVLQLQKEGLKLKKGDTHYTLWFASLAKFISLFYSRYPETEVRGLLHFLLGRLQQGQSLDLHVLQNLLGKMGRCETLLEMTSQQLEALAGGRILRNEMMTVQAPPSGAAAKGVLVITPEMMKKGARVLRDELIASGTAVPLLLYIAQVRSRILYCEDTPHLKLISHLYDTAQDVLMQFTDFLLGSMTSVGRQMESLAQLVPSLQSLVRDSGLSLSVAFQLVRPLVRAALSCGDAPESAPEYLRHWHPFHPDTRALVVDYYRSRRTEKIKLAAKAAFDRADLAAVCEGKDGCGMTVAEFEAAEELAEPDVWAVLSPEFVILFWTLGLNDLSVPSDRYSLEIRRLKERYSELEKAGAQDDKATASKARRQEATRLLERVKDLQAEFEAQTKHVESMRRVIVSYKDSFIVSAGDGTTGDLVSTRLPAIDMALQTCVLDRMLLSPCDAIYSVQFFSLLNTLDTRGFSSLLFVHRFLGCVTPVMYCCTESEMACVGHSVCEILRVVNQYSAPTAAKQFNEDCEKAGLCVDDSLYSLLGAGAALPTIAEEEKEPGMVDAVNSDGSARSVRLAEWKAIAKQYVDRLTKIILLALVSKEYMSLRAVLILLAKIAEEFHIRASTGEQILKRVQAIEAEQQKAGRGDLELMARSTAAHLRRHSSHWLDANGNRVKVAEKKEAKPVAPSVAPAVPVESKPKPKVESQVAVSKTGARPAPAPEPATSSLKRKHSDVGLDRPGNEASKRPRDNAGPPDSDRGSNRPPSSSGARDGQRDGQRDNPKPPSSGSRGPAPPASSSQGNREDDKRKSLNGGSVSSKQSGEAAGNRSRSGTVTSEAAKPRPPSGPKDGPKDTKEAVTDAPKDTLKAGSKDAGLDNEAKEKERERQKLALEQKLRESLKQKEQQGAKASADKPAATNNNSSSSSKAGPDAKARDARPAESAQSRSNPRSQDSGQRFNPRDSDREGDHRQPKDLRDNRDSRDGNHHGRDGRDSRERDGGDQRPRTSMGSDLRGSSNPNPHAGTQRGNGRDDRSNPSANTSSNASARRPEGDLRGDLRGGSRPSQSSTPTNAQSQAPPSANKRQRR